MDVETAERLARLETHMERLIDLSEENHKDIHEVKSQLTKWKGIGGGIALTVSAIWGAVWVVVEFFKK